MKGWQIERVQHRRPELVGERERVREMAGKRERERADERESEHMSGQGM